MDVQLSVGVGGRLEMKTQRNQMKIFVNQLKEEQEMKMREYRETGNQEMRK